MEASGARVVVARATGVDLSDGRIVTIKTDAEPLPVAGPIAFTLD